MTIKHINADGHEEIIPIVSVNFDPATKTVVSHGKQGDRSWDKGRIFVMNDFGKTVAVYTLGGAA